MRSESYKIKATSFVFAIAIILKIKQLTCQQMQSPFNGNQPPNQQFNPNSNQQFQNQGFQQQQQQAQFQPQFQQNQQQNAPQPGAPGQLQQTIYQFLKSNQRTNRFAQLIDSVSGSEQTLVNILSAGSESINKQMSGSGRQITVFAPVNEALNQVSNDISQVKNDISNLIVKQSLTLDQLRQLNGQQLSGTFGYKPKLYFKIVKNSYLTNESPQTQPKPQARRQAVYPKQYKQQQQFPNQYQYQTTTFSSTPYPDQQQSQYRNSSDPNNNLSVYDNYLASGLASSSDPNMPSYPKLPLDELFLLNSAIIIDRVELVNGVVYLLNSYPRYYDKSILLLLQDNEINGLAQNLNFWITRAAQSLRANDESLKNALNAFGSNTYFLPVDQAFNKFTDRQKLNNNTYLFDNLFKAHRVSNRLLFDYYLDESKPVIYTDTMLPVATVHRRLNGQDDIEISIGHVKGKILPEFRNIFCASGVVHLIDTVLGEPNKNAYQEISNTPELSSFRAILDRSTKYKQLLDSTPAQSLVPSPLPRFNEYNQNSSSFNRVRRQMVNTPLMPINPQQQTQQNQFFNPQQQQQNQFFNPQQQQQQQQQPINQFNQQQPFNQPQYVSPNQNQFSNTNSNFRLMTILAPSDAALLAIKEDILRNDSLVDEFLSNHIIVDSNSNRVFYTDHDDSVFQNGQTYSTLNPNIQITAQVIQDPTSVANRVSLYLTINKAIKTSIKSGNSRVSNGVIHIVDKPLTQISSSDITVILDKYSSQNSPDTPAFNQFVDVLRSTGILNDLKQPAKKYTLFIPTNQALASYQDIINSNDIDKKKRLIYRHICLDQNLPSHLLQADGQPTTNAPSTPNYNQQDSSNQLICRNALGQDLTLTKDENGLYSKWKDMAQSKVLNDFSGQHSSAYVLESTLLNQNLPNLGLISPNSGSNLKVSFLLMTFVCLVFSVMNYNY